MGLLDAFERDREATRQREGDRFRDPLAPRPEPAVPPALAALLAAANRRGYLVPAETARPRLRRLWAARCVKRSLPDVRLSQQCGCRTLVVTIDVRPLEEPPAPAAVELLLERLREASDGRGRVLASSTTILGSRVPSREAPKLARWIVELLTHEVIS